MLVIAVKLQTLRGVRPLNRNYAQQFKFRLYERKMKKEASNNNNKRKTSYFFTKFLLPISFIR